MRRLLAVLGGDVSRSLSPLLHGAAAAACGLDIAYVPVSCPAREDFDRAVDALMTLGALGANVTIPHKLAAFERAHELSQTAREIGAVNTLMFRDGRIDGENTDGPGLIAVLEDFSLDRVQVLGAGGVSKAAVWALERSGAREVVVCARGGKAARPLEPVEGASLVISTLPKGEAIAREAMAHWIDTRSSPAILDLAYGDTPLVALARERGLRATDGLPLLVEQAARSLALWTGGELSCIRDAMRAAIAGPRL